MDLTDQELELCNKNLDDLQDLLEKIVKYTDKPSLRYAFIAGSGLHMLASGLSMCNSMHNLEFQIKQLDIKLDEMKLSIRKDLMKKEKQC